MFMFDHGPGDYSFTYDIKIILMNPFNDHKHIDSAFELFLHAVYQKVISSFSATVANILHI